MVWQRFGLTGSAAPLVIGGAAMFFIASRAGVDALAGSDPKRPGWRALGHWMPIAATAVAALLLKSPQVAVAVVFSTSVACLALVFGVITYLAPPIEALAPPRAWGFVLPAALLPLIAGFGGQFTWFHAVLMLALGGAFLGVWLERPASLQEVLSQSANPVAAASPTINDSSAMSEDPAARDARLQRRILQSLLAIAVAGVGGVAAVKGLTAAGRVGSSLPSGTLAATVLSPLLILPMLGPGAILAQKGESSSVASTMIAVVLLNLCGLLPMLILLWYPVSLGHYPLHNYRALAGRLLEISLPYGAAIWRVDTVILTVLGFALVPVALGRWVLGRLEGFGLIVGYAAYLFLTATMAWQ